MIKRIVKILTISVFIFSFASPQGTIIILNGTSSAGKSSIVKKITNCVDLSMDRTTYNVIAEITETYIFNTLDQKAIDVLIANDIFTKEKTQKSIKYKLPRNNPELFESKMELMEKLLPSIELDINYEQERLGERVDEEMIREAIQLSNNGQNVIIDTIIDYESEKEAVKEGFKDRKVYSVLVYCPPAELVSRVRQRNKTALETGTTETEARELQNPIEQFLRMYTTSDDSQKNPLLNSLENPTDARVSQETLKTIFEDGADLFEEKYDIESLKKTALEQWGLQNRRFATIVPKDPYDLIVDNGPTDAAAHCAKQIQKLIPSAQTSPQKTT